MKAVVLVLVPVAVFAFESGRLLTPPPVTPSRSTPPVVAVSRDAPNQGDVDTYGNDVTPAVAEYSLDPAGSLYEVHAPQVELPKLGSPQS